MGKKAGLGVKLFLPDQEGRSWLRELLEGSGLALEAVGSVQEALEGKGPALLDLEQALQEGQVLDPSSCQVFLLARRAGAFRLDEARIKERSRLSIELGHRAKNMLAVGETSLTLLGLGKGHEPELASLVPFLATMLGMMEAERCSFDSLLGGSPTMLQYVLEYLEDSITDLLEGRERPIKYELEDLTLGPAATRELCLLFGPLLAEILESAPQERTIPLTVVRTPAGGELRVGAACPGSLRRDSLAAVLAEGFGARLEAGDGASVRVGFSWPESSWTGDARWDGPVPQGEVHSLDSVVLAAVGDEGQRAKLVETLTRSGAWTVFPPSAGEILKAYADWPARHEMSPAGLLGLVHWREVLVADQALLTVLCGASLTGLASSLARDEVRTVHCRQRVLLEAEIGLVDRLLHPWAFSDPGTRTEALAREVLAVWNSGARLDYAATLQGDLSPSDEQVLFLALNELVSNSARHAYPEGRAGQIRVSLREVEGDLELVVADDGHGIDPGALPGPYGPGQEPPAEFSGLVLIQAILSNARGRLDFGPGPGTTATLSFPRSTD